MNNLDDIKKMKHCPLCHNLWKMVEEEGKTGKIYFVCVEPSCMISIWVRDPALGQYERMMDECPTPCPHCGDDKMRFFFRSDGYMKWLCSKCKCSIEEHDPVKHGEIKDGIPVIEENPSGGLNFVRPDDFKNN